MRIKKTHQKFFLLKAIFCTRSKQFRQRFQKLWLKYDIFFDGNWKKLSKKVSFVEQRLFSKCSNVHFDCKLDTPAEKFLRKVQNELKKNKKNSTKKLIYFLSIFSFGLLQTCHRMQEKRDTSRAPLQMWKVALENHWRWRDWSEKIFQNVFFSRCKILRERSFSLSKT